MRKLFLAIGTLLSVTALLALSTEPEVRTLIVKTTDNVLTKFNISDIEEITFDTEPANAVTVTRLLNLTPDFISVEGLAENQSLIPGEEAELTLKAGSTLYGEFQDYHFQHLHIQINDEIIVPTAPDDYTATDSINVSFTVPETDCDIVVCYSGQQQLSDTGYTMTLEDNDNVKLYGVSPNLTYKYFDAYLLANEAFVIQNVEFKMGDGEWQSVNETTGCKFETDDNLDNLYDIKIRPDYKNVTGDVVLRVSGEQHQRYNISWVNADETYFDMEKSSFPTQAIDGDAVLAELYINDDYYLKGVTTSSSSTEVTTPSGCYVSFTMPAEDITVTLDMANKIPVSTTSSDYITKASFYDAPDIFYGVEVSVATPGESIYIVAQAIDGYKPKTATIVAGDKAIDGYKPKTATTDAGATYDFSFYGLEMYLCEIPVPVDATSLTASIDCVQAWSVSSEQTIQCDDALYAEGETVSISIQVPTGQKIDSVTAVGASSGTDIAVTLDSPYATFVMPAEDVTVTVTYSDLTSGETVSVIAYYDDNQYDVSSSTNYDWDFAEGFTMDKDATFYLSIYDYYGDSFYVGIKIGETVTTYSADEDPDSGEYSFGKALVATGDVTIKVGATEDSVAFEDEEETETVSVIATYDSDQYSVKSSTNYDWNFANGFTVEKGTSFYLSVVDNYGENFYVGVKIGDDTQTYSATADEDTGEYTFGQSITATGDVTIKVGATAASVAFEDEATETVSVIATYDSDQYTVKSSTNYDWNFANGFTVEKGSSFYLSVVDNYGENFYVGVKIGDDAQTYSATADEDTGEYTFGQSITATGDVTIKVGATQSSVAF